MRLQIAQRDDGRLQIAQRDDGKGLTVALVVRNQSPRYFKAG